MKIYIYMNIVKSIIIKISFFLLAGFLFPFHCRGEEQEEKVYKQEQGFSKELYEDYKERFDSIREESHIAENGFRKIEDQIFIVDMQNLGEVTFIPALDRRFNRLALFLSDEKGNIIYKTEQLETNSRNRGELYQPNKGIAAVSFQDMNGDGLTDIVLITSCMSSVPSYKRETYKVGDVLFQNEKGFYRDWRLSDKINRFSMNKSIEFIVSFVRDGYSTEFLYTATTLKELQENGFQIEKDQCYWRQFEKMGKLQVVPGTMSLARHSVFMLYLINEQGYIVWSFQPMGEYDHLYALKGVTCRDIDGDGLKDIVVLMSLSYLGEEEEPIVQTDYSIYYQRTGGFYEDKEIKESIPCQEEDSMEGIIEKAREYWGWRV